MTNPKQRLEVGIGEIYEIILGEVIDNLYLHNKKDFADYKNKTHRLGWFKEQVKADYHEALKRHMTGKININLNR